MRFAASQPIVKGHAVPPQISVMQVPPADVAPVIDWVAFNEAITPGAWRGNNWTMVSSILWYQPPALSVIRIVQNDSQPTTSNQDLRAAADLRGVLFRQHL
jgi:hypothetical protein